ncbi:hypothetical protein JRG66_09395 [Salinimicrobium tongyeongense]|uniref:Bacteriophage holin family protein n=1 Tax=Salinimicrobium tongyeongense TaxID=2809707 RepID=A0ABY6NMV0_9FLAO|nr:hypothetical protein [Salinimicrobium tongyeongense]UZH54212.1 hypothetical protein JRG66_09395 [Salinimicrobium tongyeongense]
MIWFKIKRLEKLLAQGELSDITAFKYLLSHLLLWALLNNIPVNTPSVPLWSLYAKLLIALAAISWGISKTFKINQNGDGRDYLKRLISLSLVASLKTLVIFFIIAAIIATAMLFAAKIGFILPDFWNDILNLLVHLLLLGAYYKILLTSFSRINASPVSKQNPSNL